MFIGNNALLLGCGGSGFVTAASGDRLIRHESGMGTVMSSDELRCDVLVLDARYRTRSSLVFDVNKNGGVDGKELGLPHVSCFGSAGVTYCGPDPNTSRYNTDCWAKSDRFNLYPRTVMVNGTGCDLPNVQILKRIWVNRAELDALDPTLASASAHSLVTWWSGGAWSSSYHNLYCNIYVKNDGTFYMYSTGAMVNQGASLGIIPILEL